MVKIVFVEPDKSIVEVDAELGENVMEAAVRNNVPGIVGECGGACACCTCHVIVAPNWFKAVGEPMDFETEMLVLASERSETSRLACQIEVTEDLGGLILNVPKEQGN